MKIVRIIARLNVGGPARHVALLNEGLDRRGHQTLLIHGSLDAGEASLEPPAGEGGIRLARLDHLGRRVHASSDLRALRMLYDLIRREQPDVVHTHTAKAGTLGRLAALAWNASRPPRQRALLVHTFHGHVFEGYFSPARSRAVRFVERTLARATDTIVTISPRQRADIVERFRVAPAAKTVVVPLGLDLATLLAMPADAVGLREQLGIAPGDVVIGYAGRMVPVKDLPTLLHGFALALTTQPRLRLVLAGDGPERAGAEALAGRLGIAGQTHFIGWTGDLRRFYATLDLFALSSLNEGTPVAAIEALAAARPVVATDVGGVADVIDADTCGRLVPARSPEALGRALAALAGDPEGRRRMGEAGRASVRARYAQERLVDDIERLYIEGLRRRR